MIIQRNHKRRGFTLIELAIVLGVAAAIISGIWTYASSATQSAKVEQAVEDISLTVDSTRAAYNATAAISGGIVKVMQYLIGNGSMPNHLVNNMITACIPGAQASGHYAVSPFSPLSGSNDGCGTLRVCAWVAGIGAPSVAANKCDTAGGGGLSSQLFAVEFTPLDPQSCMALATRATPTSPIAGLKDVYINGTSGLLATGSLPVTPNQAEINCSLGGLNGNIVDFVYSLRTPS